MTSILTICFPTFHNLPETKNRILALLLYMPGQRYIRLFTEPPKRQNDWEKVEEDVEDALKKNVKRVQQKMAEMAGRGERESVYLGDVGVAFMEMSIARARRGLLSGPEDGDVLSTGALSSLSDLHLSSSIQESSLNPRNIRDGAHLSFLETPIGVATLILNKYPLGRNQNFVNAPWKKCRDFLLRGVEVIVSDDRNFGDDDDGCEVLYGRAGFLYALLFLRNAFVEKEGGETEGDGVGGLDQDIESCRTLLSDETLQTVVHSIIRRGRNGAKTYSFEFGPANSPPLMWTWHLKRYLGGAHGVAGILQMLLNCPFSIISSYMPEIVQTIDWLINVQDRVGNWPTRAPDLNQTTSGENDLVQWCHGAPSMLILLSTILRMSVTPGITTGLTDKQQERFVVSLQRGCAQVYIHGFLRKGVGLCHGVAGSVYALLAASDILDDPSNANSDTPTPTSSVSSQEHSAPYFTQAAHLAHQATSATSLTRKGEMRAPDHPWSLYEGMAGMCCAWQEILYRLKYRGRSFLCSGMPGYDDLCRLIH